MEVDPKLVLGQQVFNLLADSGFPCSDCEAALDVAAILLRQQIFPEKWKAPVRPPELSDGDSAS